MDGAGYAEPGGYEGGTPVYGTADASAGDGIGAGAGIEGGGTECVLDAAIFLPILFLCQT